MRHEPAKQIQLSPEADVDVDSRFSLILDQEAVRNHGLGLEEDDAVEIWHCPAHVGRCDGAKGCEYLGGMNVDEVWRGEPRNAPHRLVENLPDHVNYNKWKFTREAIIIELSPLRYVRNQ